MPKPRDGRPDITSLTTGAELRRWYWLKSELEAHAKAVGIRATGGKFTLLDRLAHHLDTGETQWPGDVRTAPRSKFDWHSAELTLETVITDSYRNTQNVRRFFKAHAGDGFKFNIAFMAWMKANTGKTLAVAVAEYHRLKAEEAAPGFQSKIAHHNQFNQYTRDFLADNPDRGMADVRKYWALKRETPSESGRHVYHPSDLDLG
ncbi:DUF6434 domain-containing protein [uncultured Roseobacter sp.]|uniref:DUF6434 domain-containing protein n=1 Tax=uncultured Roseobacter sp. TaxID=114847 RepID=UPI00262C51C1|nr:DUF6434 domain-containing protein [uncultured Roseobacter sp.]